MAARMSRRDLLVALAGLTLPRLARASGTLITLAVQPAVSSIAQGDRRRDVVDRAFLEDQFDHATRLYAPFGIAFAFRPSRPLDARFARIETRRHRDALRAELQSHAINVFFVESLRDVDDTSQLRMGVTWRARRSPKYVIVASSAVPTSTAHELGHVLGLGHTKVKNNLMSYDRKEGSTFLDERQGGTARRSALHLRDTQLGALY